MKLLSIFAILTTLLCVSSSAEVITCNLGISDARKAMVTAGYKQTTLEMMARNYPKEELECWDVDQGVLIAVYSSSTKRIIELSFYLSDDRPKDTRKTFDLKVASFNTTTGVMTINIKKIENPKDRYK